MYSTINQSNKFRSGFEHISEPYINAIPSYEKNLDSFFKRNAQLIIDEWQLVTDEDLHNLQRKLENLSYEVNRLVYEKSSFESRVVDLKSAISALEHENES